MKIQKIQKKIKYNEEYNFKNIKNNRINNNNDTKYKILFDENKKMNLNSLREEYNKIKKDNNHNNYNKRYINIFNDNKQKINSNLLLKIGNNKRKLNKNIITNINYDNNNQNDEFKIKFNFKSNNNSKRKEINNRLSNFKSQLIEEDTLIFDKNKKKSNIFSSINGMDNSAKKKNKDNFWNNKYKNIINNKKKGNKFFIYEEYKTNTLNNNLKYNNNKKSTIIEYSYINNKNNHKMNLLKKYNKLCEELLCPENNSKINSIISFNKISESNSISNFDNDFNKLFNIVESKIRQNKIDIKLNEENNRYYTKSNINKIIPKLLTKSENDFWNNCLRKNNKYLYKNKLNTQISTEYISPYKKETKKYIISDFSINQKKY